MRTSTVLLILFFTKSWFHKFNIYLQIPSLRTVKYVCSVNAVVKQINTGRLTQSGFANWYSEVCFASVFCEPERNRGSKASCSCIFEQGFTAWLKILWNNSTKSLTTSQEFHRAVLNPAGFESTTNTKSQMLSFTEWDVFPISFHLF